MRPFTTYVAGFLFTTDKKSVWLIRKEKPEWQKGLLNGIGGKVEEGETAKDAMIREFKEEAGLEIKEWKQFATLTDDRSYVVDFFYAFSDENPMSMTLEQVVCYMFTGHQHWNSRTIPNLQWLLPMALSFEDGERANKFLVIEKYEKPI